MDAAARVAEPLDSRNDAQNDSLTELEDRIVRTVALVERLRAERDAALAELHAVRNTAATSVSDTQKLRQEVESLRGERKSVRARIEKLLGQMETLAGS
jgi:uncharacterized coiled-coil DUF342 family protein